ncbi:hypothetical protein [Streptomyces sp. GESEQ-35]|uniref:hypothetical protein n=1 Tax=Streptomyces sp. GESEQ-35 TaxID=2812657 RepID=UPI001B32180D|nr:hypothetical protein [Streptomyces sp. GESEQ-35]
MADDPQSAHERKLRRWANEAPPDPTEAIVGVLQLLGKAAIKRAQVPRPRHLDLLTFDEIVRYFVEERPDTPEVDHGALLIRQGLASGIPCLQLFVDSANRPCLSPTGSPHGRFMVARRLDRELTAMLGGRELIIFE